MYKKHRDLPIRQCPHPPFPSFAWVITAQANPPSPAYAYGYIRNVRAHARPRPRAHNSICLPARGALPPGLHEYPPSLKRSSTRPPPSPTRARTAAVLAAERNSEKLMETVDYRYDDPPSRPCVPWLEGYTLPRRGASTQRQVPYEDSEELVLPPFSIAEPPTASTSARVSKCRFASSASGSDDARPSRMKRTRTRAGTTVDVVKINRLDVCALILT